jgi:PAS domain S-box-containing protein
MSAISTDPSHAHGAPADASTESEGWARQRTVMLAFGRRINSSGAPPSLIDDAAALLAETLEMSFFGSARCSEDRVTLDLRLTGVGGAAREAQLPWDADSLSKDSMAGYAIARHEVVVCCNLDAAPFKDGFLRTTGMMSGIVVPLGTTERPLGAFGVFESVERTFSPQEAEFAETIGQMLSATLARLHAESHWQRERQLANAMIDDNAELIIMTDLEGRVTRANRACEEALGYAAKDLLGRSLWNTLVAPEDLHDTQRFARNAIEQQTPTQGNLPLRTRQGQLKTTRVTVRAVVDGAGSPTSILFSGAATDAAPQPQKDDPQPFQATADAMASLRASPRRAFRYRQRVAKYEPDRPPESLKFDEVQFEDISAGGVSFFLDYQPTFETVVLALGAPPNLHYLSARITSVTELMRDGQRAYKIGCRFLDRW